MNRPIVRRSAALLIVLLALAGHLAAQETASRYFERVSERYESIEDYSADLTITKGETVQTAEVMYKAPNLLRLDFTEPDGMVMAVDDEQLQIWVPDYSVTFAQPLRRSSQAQMANLASSRGLDLMKRYYTVAYATSPEPEPLDPGSNEQVVKLRLVWKSNNEGFRELELSIDSDLRIRRVIGNTTTGETIEFDFTNLVLNRGIPETRFQYESPPTGNTIENFLFDPES